MKRLASTLSNWSRREFGDVFAIVRDYEDQVQTAEAEVMTNNTEVNRAHLQQVNAKYIRYLKLEESFLKQKTTPMVQGGGCKH